MGEALDAIGDKAQERALQDLRRELVDAGLDVTLKTVETWFGWADVVGTVKELENYWINLIDTLAVKDVSNNGNIGIIAEYIETVGGVPGRVFSGWDSDYVPTDSYGEADSWLEGAYLAFNI